MRTRAAAVCVDSSGGILSETKRRYFRRGLYAAGGIALCIAIVVPVCLAFSYDGKCGGFFPGLSVRRLCTFWDYATGDMLVIVMILGEALWPFALGLLLLPPIAGYLFDRRA